MPSHPCKVPTCTNYVKWPALFCADHEAEAKIDALARAQRRNLDARTIAARNRYYDQHARDPAAKAFYNSARWKLARDAYIAEHPVCQRCENAWAQHVHHIKPLRDCSDEEKTQKKNLLAVCQPCHNTIEAEQEKQALCETSK